MGVKILFISDIVGKPGRDAVEMLLPEIMKEEKFDFCIANGENAAGGFGITPSIITRLYSMDVDVITLGNHVWDRKEIYDCIEDPRLIRPANYPAGVPGNGYCIASTKQGIKIGVANISGRVFMQELDCPFRCADKVINNIMQQTNIIVIDFHAEVTSEKAAFGWYVDGRVSAVIGTHTHVPTADERILHDGTAYITDAGMTGPCDSVIGIKKEIAIQRFLTQMPFRFEVASDNIILNSVLVEVDESTGRAKSIKRIQKKL